MVRLLSSTARVSSLWDGPKIVVAAVGLAILPVHLCVGQERGTSSVAARPPLRISVIANVKNCGEAIRPVDVQNEATTRLQGSGITVSSIHNAQLALDVECVAVTPDAEGSSLAVHHCLSFSELVISPAKNGHPTLPTTWRKCQSYTCGRATCQATARSRSGFLIYLFLGGFRATGNGSLRRGDPVPVSSAPVKASTQPRQVQLRQVQRPSD